MMTRSAVGVLAALALAAGQDPTSDPLCQAARKGSVTQVSALLARGANVNVRDDQGRTPLMWAASVAAHSIEYATKDSDYLAVALLLLNRGAEVDARDPSERTPLLLAMEGSASEYKVTGADQDMARLLIEKGANVNARDREGWSPLLMVVNLWADQPELISFLISHGAHIKATLKDGRNALMLAGRLGKSGRLQMLIDRGADVNAADNQGTTALMVVSESRFDDAATGMMKELLDRGANPNLVDGQGQTAADRAVEAGYIERAEYLIQRGTVVADKVVFFKNARNRALVRAISGGSVAAALRLLDQGADPDFRDHDGRTLLMMAATEPYSAEKANLLLDHHASPNLVDAQDQTALMFAVDQYQPDIVQALLAHGANPNSTDLLGNTVLMRAAASRHSWMEDRKPLIALLLAKGADVKRANRRGVTALMLMAREGNPALGLLIEKGADVKARDEEGNTALLYAARFFVREWQRRDGWTLLENGADVNAANQLGETALILAATQYEVDAVRLLLAKGADVNARTTQGRTALMQSIDGPKEFDNEHHVVYSPKIATILIDSGADVNAHDIQGQTALKLATRRGCVDMAAILKRAGAKE